ncbi:hypothetical protein [Desulfoluna spongiiphila]|uniref:Uncharacterized protein n=1 Tax=Desulfoluna spongiiphila TaxID=419481 RepID=A0A1G5IM49_9BACT|nr:hypothetical protein [Desulfoluna spongiiphila]SCY76821.1 hypothetical protein SAMN05216233_120108 [Desulfoluna spongiiphila]
MDVSWKVAIKVWFSFFWRTVAFSFLFGIVLAVFIIIVDIAGFTSLSARFITEKYLPLIIWAAQVPIQILAIKGALKAEYSDFHISLVDIKQGFSKKVLIKSPS